MEHFLWVQGDSFFFMPYYRFEQSLQTKNNIAKETYDITVSATFSYHLLMLKMIMYYSGLLL